MKATGIVRPLDELGRVVIPIELRRSLGLGAKEPVEIYVEQDRVILKKYEPACLFCGSFDDVIKYKSRLVCNNCVTEMSHIA